MKHFVTLIFGLYLFTQSAFAQAPSWNWSHATQGTTADFVLGLATDKNGNSLVTGYFTSPTFKIGSFSFNRLGGQTVFIAKYDPSGNVVWAKIMGGSQYDRGNAIATDADGNVYVSGEFTSSTITLGTISVNNLSSSGKDIFVAKLDASGKELWVKVAGGNYSEESYGVAADKDGNVFITGRYGSNPAKFGDITINSMNGTTDFFLAKYDASGKELWVKTAGGTLNDGGFGLVTDANGNAYVAGSFFSSSMNFESITLTSAGVNDHYVVKFDGSGNVLWAKSAGGEINDFGAGISLAPDGGVFVTGEFTSQKIVFGSTTLTNSGGGDIFVTHYDATGAVVWAKGIGGNLEDYGRGIAADKDGNVYVTGDFSSSTINFGSTTLTNVGFTDIFVTKLDGSGNILWAVGAGDSMKDYGYSVSTDPQNNVIVSGNFFSRNLKLGNVTLSNDSYKLFGYKPFVAKLGNTPSSVIKVSDSEIGISPNPAKGSFTLTVPAAISGTNTQIEILNTLGAIVYKQALTHSETTVLTDMLAAGTYIVRIKNANYVGSVKLMVMGE